MVFHIIRYVIGLVLLAISAVALFSDTENNYELTKDSLRKSDEVQTEDSLDVLGEDGLRKQLFRGAILVGIAYLIIACLIFLMGTVFSIVVAILIVINLGIQLVVARYIINKLPIETLIFESCHKRTPYTVAMGTAMNLLSMVGGLCLMGVI